MPRSGYFSSKGNHSSARRLRLPHKTPSPTREATFRKAVCRPVVTTLRVPRLPFDANDGRMRLIPLGGCGQVFGPNATLLAAGGGSLCFDFGMGQATHYNLTTEADEDGRFGGHPVHYVIPDHRLLQSQPGCEFEGIVLTHGHLDHIGGLKFIWNLLPLGLKVYGSPYALSLLRSHLGDQVAARFGLIPIEPGRKFKVGAIKLEPFATAHSMVQTLSFVVRYRDKYGEETRGLYLSDARGFVADAAGPLTWGTDGQKINDVLKEGCSFITVDSTNSGVDKPVNSFEGVQARLNEIAMITPGKVIMAQYAANLDYLPLALKAAHASGREFFIGGESLEKNLAALKVAGLMDERGSHHLRPVEEARRRKVGRGVFIYGTGAQAEPGSLLDKIVTDRLRGIHLAPEDAVINATRDLEPEAKKRLRQIAISKGAVWHDCSNANELYVTGHATQGALRNLLSRIERLSPPNALPQVLAIHGTVEHQQALYRLAKICKVDVQMPINGDIFVGEGNLMMRERTMSTRHFTTRENTLLVVNQEGVDKARTGWLSRELDKREGVLVKFPALPQGPLAVRIAEARSRRRA